MINTIRVTNGPGPEQKIEGLTGVTFQGTINQDDFVDAHFPGDLRDKYLAGGVGTHTRADNGAVWTKQP
ncbi:MAG: hypothetical protein FWC06_00300 [Treponema sp.]|nr:hypothetical protein [Treponema sp.]